MRLLPAFVLMDLSAQRRSVLTLPIVVVVMVVLARASGLPVAVGLLMAASFVPAILPIQFFTADEHGRLDLLAATLPISRPAVVIGRHLTLGTLAALMSATCGLGAWVSLRVAPPSDAFPVATVFSLGFALICLLLTLQVPLYFALGPSTGISMATAAVFLAAMWMAGHTSVDMGPVLRALTSWWAPGAAVLTGLALMAVSALVSVPLYARRSL